MNYLKEEKKSETARLKHGWESIQEAGFEKSIESGGERQCGLWALSVDSGSETSCKKNFAQDLEPGD